MNQIFNNFIQLTYVWRMTISGNFVWISYDVLKCYIICLWVFLALNFAHICVLVYVAPCLFLGLRQEWKRAAAVKVYFRQENRTGGKKRQEMTPPPHTHAHIHRKGYASMLHTLLGGTHCMNEAVVWVICVCHLFLTTLMCTHPSNSSSCSCESLWKWATFNLVISFFFSGRRGSVCRWNTCLWDVYVRRACGHARGGSSARPVRLMPRGRAIRQKRGTDEGGAQDRQRMMTTRIQTETGGQWHIHKQDRWVQWKQRRKIVMRAYK